MRVIFHLPFIFKLWVPEIWRLLTPFWLTGPKLSILFDTVFCKFSTLFTHGLINGAALMKSAVWQYSSGLELESSRFPQPGDYFVYIIFLGLFILVCTFVHLAAVFYSSSFSLSTSHICPPSLFLAEAVPGDEEDYPCIFRGPVIRNPYKKGPRAVRARWKSQLRKPT